MVPTEALASGGGAVLNRGGGEEGEESGGERRGVHEGAEGREGGRIDVSAFLRSPSRLQGRAQVPSAERANALAPQGEELLRLHVGG